MHYIILSCNHCVCCTIYKYDPGFSDSNESHQYCADEKEVTLEYDWNAACFWSFSKIWHFFLNCKRNTLYVHYWKKLN